MGGNPQQQQFAETASVSMGGVLSNINRKVKPVNSVNNSSIQSYVDQSLIQFTSNKKETVSNGQKVRLITQNQFLNQTTNLGGGGQHQFVIHPQQIEIGVMQANAYQQDGGAVVLPSNNAKKRSLILKS